MKDKKRLKILSVIAVGIVLFAITLAYALVLILNTSVFSTWIGIGISVFYALVLGVLVYVIIERIKEIRSGEEDDLSKY